MPVNDKIRVVDYNSIRSKVVDVLGTGSANSGYGQTLLSSAVTESNSVSINDYAKLRYDIVNAYKHIFGTNPVTVTPALGNTIRYDTDFAPSSNMALEAPNTQYNTYADQLIANRFTVHASQSATYSIAPSSTTWPGPYGASWSTRIACTVTATWTTAEKARHFFNAGGEIRFASSRTLGSGVLGTTQCTSWSNTLTSAGTRSFGGAIPNTGTNPNDGTNYFRCSNVDQVWYSLSASSPYGANTYRISANTPFVADNSFGTANTVSFLIEFIDNYVDPDASTPPGTVNVPPGDAVDGTFIVNVSYLYATGILEPTGTGNFTVEEPVIVVSAIAP